jgi:SAM-dependent methyltransferase
MTLSQYFLMNKARPIHKNVHYLPIYERHFAHMVNRPLVMFEIGAGGGGSSQMWKHYFGAFAQIVAIDINPGAAAFEDEQVKVRIGSQADHAFLADVISEFGAPDIVLDDGSHRMDDIQQTFQFLYQRTAWNGIYLVEDLHTAYWDEFGGGFRTPGTFIERCKDFIDEINADHTRGFLPPTEITRSTLSMHIYDSIVVFERGRYLDKRSIITGDRDHY